MKNIVIVGSSRGIGKELVQLLANDNNVLALSRNLAPLKDFKKNSNVIIEKFDVSNDALTPLLQKHFKSVDIIVNNAGLLINKPLLELSDKDIELSYQTNVFGLIKACQSVVPFMLKKGGHIINIGSMGGFQGSVKFPGLSVYSSSKAAVASFTECLAEELRDTNIKANCLALGAAQTEMLNEAFPDYKAPVSAYEMAKFIADFSLNAHQWINGKVIPVSLSTP
ncbi:MAG TPA: SDR family oxidoreductase [Crocinitomix sp.]|nr:SDR family oxidoreductase [Crocinitomix sp.]